jgi:hypothetical protein
MIGHGVGFQASRECEVRGLFLMVWRHLRGGSSEKGWGPRAWQRWRGQVCLLKAMAWKATPISHLPPIRPGSTGGA